MLCGCAATAAAPVSNAMTKMLLMMFAVVKNVVLLLVTSVGKVSGWKTETVWKYQPNARSELLSSVA